MEKIVWAVFQRFIIPKVLTHFFVTDISETCFHLPGERDLLTDPVETRKLPTLKLGHADWVTGSISSDLLQYLFWSTVASSCDQLAWCAPTTGNCCATVSALNNKSEQPRGRLPTGPKLRTYQDLFITGKFSSRSIFSRLPSTSF